METPTLHAQYIVDNDDQKTAVIIPLKQYEQLLAAWRDLPASVAPRGSARQMRQQPQEDKHSWQQYIHANTEILSGKPVVRGTRLAVDFILNLFAAGWTEEQVLENYPTLTAEAIRAVFAFATECMHEAAFYAIPLGTG